VTRFVVDCGAVLHLASERIDVRAEHELLAPTRLGWAETYDAEYVALTQLQADALVTLDAGLARRVEGVVPTATIEALQTA
jgi:hypothetical protein